MIPRIICNLASWAMSLAVISAQAGPPAEPKEQADEQTFKVLWNDGLRLETSDREFQLRIGGRIHQDWAFFDADEAVESQVGSFEDGAEIRRARLYLSGILHKKVEFKIEYDFAAGEVVAKDVFVGLVGLPCVGALSLGHFKEPFSLEELTSSNHATFMERGLPNIFAPSRNLGVRIQNHVLDDRLTWAAGGFRETDDTGFAVGEDTYAFSGRLTGLPYRADGGRQVVHLGLSYTHRKPEEDLLRIRQRPEAHLAPRLVDTGSFPARSLDSVALEAAAVAGPFSIQSEYTHSSVDRPEAESVGFDGFYMFGSVFLTGEHRAYRASSGTFDRVKPRRSFLGDGGPGAWEVALRYSRLNLDSLPVTGGKLDDLTLGLTWYLNPFARFMWNYVHADREDVGDADIFQFRFQVDF